MDNRYEASRQKMMVMYGKMFRDRGDMWAIPTLKYNQHIRRFNEAEFPPELPETCIKSHWDWGRRTITVYDPFLGGGTTALVAALVANHLDCNFYGCDISRSYVDGTKKRLRKYGKKNKN